MKTIGLFEAKTRLSELCDQVAETHEPVTVTKRGKPLVRIDPIESDVMTIRERRAAYLAGEGLAEVPDGEDFEPPARSEERSAFAIEDEPSLPLST